jgi:hypothetical protein
LPSTDAVGIGSGIAAFIAGLPGNVPSAAIALGLSLVGLLVLVGVRGRRRTRGRRWNATKIAPRRDAGRSRNRRPPREQTDLKKGASSEETTPEMMPASTRNYHQALEVLLRQPGKKTGLDSLQRLLVLARALDQHRAGDLQDLSGFRGEVERLLGFEVRARPIANSTGVAIRLMHGGELIDEAAGPFRSEIVDRVGEHARVLQRDLVAWLDSLNQLRSGEALGEPRVAARPRFAGVDVAHDAHVASPSPLVTAIDVSGLRSLDEPARSDRMPVKVPSGPPPREPTWAADTAMLVTAPTPTVDRDRSRLLVEAAEPDDRLGGAPPDSLVQRPSLRGLSPRWVRSIEGIDDIVAELAVEPPETLHAGERFFKSDSSERTSLLDRLDRLVFTPLDAAATNAELDPNAGEVVAWFRRRQDELIETLRHEFGLRAYDPAIGDAFDPTAHVATHTVASGDRRRDRTVAGNVKHGYVLEIAGERRFLERCRVTVAVFEPTAPRREEGAASVAVPPPDEPRAGAHHVLEVPVDSAYPGERDFTITVYARWSATSPLRAWIDVDGHRLSFARADLIDVKGGQSTIQLSGCDIPETLGRGDGVLVVEDGDRRQARHPFEVLM